MRVLGELLAELLRNSRSLDCHALRVSPSSPVRSRVGPAAWSLQAHAGEILRLAVVNTPKFSGLMDDLIADFKATGGGEVSVYGGNDVFEKARAGEADLVIAHWGKSEVERFVLDGFGSWPRMVFSNQMAIVGPASDPAGIRGLKSAAEAFKKIAAAKAPFAVNALPGITYASDVLWLMAGSPAKGDWLLDPGVAKGQAMKFAEEKGAYTIWGALPFLRFKEKNASTMELMVTADPLLQRVMAAIVVQIRQSFGREPEGRGGVRCLSDQPARAGAHRSLPVPRCGRPALVAGRAAQRRRGLRGVGWPQASRVRRSRRRCAEPPADRRHHGPDEPEGDVGRNRVQRTHPERAEVHAEAFRQSQPDQRLRRKRERGDERQQEEVRPPAGEQHDAEVDSDAGSHVEERGGPAAAGADSQCRAGGGQGGDRGAPFGRRRIAGECQERHALKSVLAGNAQRIADRLVQKDDGNTDRHEKSEASCRQRPGKLNTVW